MGGKEGQADGRECQFRERDVGRTKYRIASRGVYNDR